MEAMPPTERTRLAVAGARANVGAVLGSQPRGDVARNNLFAALLILAILIALAGLIAILAQALVEGAPAIGSKLITEPPSTIDTANAGFRPAIIGSVMMMAFVIALIVPLGVGAAVYLEEYADRTRWWNRLIELNIQNLAAVALDHLRDPRSRPSSSEGRWTSGSSSSPARSRSPSSSCPW